MTRYSAIDATVGALLDATLATPNLDEGFKRGLLNAGDVLADAGSRVVPWVYITTREGEEIERQSLGTTTIRQHSRRAMTYTRLGHEFEFGDDDQISAAITINEIAGIDR